MAEMRHAERRETLAYWPAEDDEKGESVGLVTDLSEEGICVHGVHGFTKGQMLTLRIAVDKKMSGTSHITLRVRNAWSRASAVPGLYHAGFKIVEISDEARKAIRNLLQSFSYAIPRPPSDS